MKKGRPIVISAPSGTGKTTLCQRLLRSDRRLVYSVSYTTRPIRPGEANGRHYRFVRPEEFRRLRRRGLLAEAAKVFGHWYGTPRRPLERALAQGRDVLLDIDVQGARAIRRRYPEATLIFLRPPSVAALARRLRRRGQDSAADLRRRLREARRQMAWGRHYDYCVVNDRLEEAVADLKAILRAERLRLS